MALKWNYNKRVHNDDVNCDGDFGIIFLQLICVLHESFYESGPRDGLFWELATLIVIMLLGHWIEMNAISNAGDALKKWLNCYLTQSSE